MSDNISFFTAFLFGFLGSVHCVGMCGGIITAISLKTLDDKKYFYFYQFIYNIGRIFSYGLIGIFVGSFGFFFFDLFSIDVKFLFRFFFPVWTIYLGFYFLGFFKNFFSYFEKISYDFFIFLNKKKIVKVFFIKSPFKEFFIGLIWGNMPCGLVYSALSLTFVSGSILKSFFLMIFFGLGTMPSLMFTGIFYSKIFFYKKKKFFIKLIGFFTILTGFYFLINSFIKKECHLQQIIFYFS